MAAMEDHVRRADELAQVIAGRLAAERLTFEYELDPYDGGCMVHVDLADDDGFTFTVARADPIGWVEILDSTDYHLPQTALLHYVLLRARGARPYDAFDTAFKTDPESQQYEKQRRPMRIVMGILAVLIVLGCCGCLLSLIAPDEMAAFSPFNW